MLKEIILEKTVFAIMVLHQNTKWMVRIPDGDTDFFRILAGVLQDAPFLLILCLDYTLRFSADLNTEISFTFTKS